MEIIAALTLAALLGVAGLIVRALRSLEAAVREVGSSVDGLRLNSRARVNTASVRNGPQTDEAVLVRLGRSTRARRVVVGGEEGSPLHTHLSRSLSRPGDDMEPADMPEAPDMPQSEAWTP